ncbi:hypothetical protein D3C85_1344090 [compost metagenome]
MEIRADVTLPDPYLRFPELISLKRSPALWTRLYKERFRELWYNKSLVSLVGAYLYKFADYQVLAIIPPCM